MTDYWAHAWPIWLSAFCVLAIYSYLVKDNAVYRVMMQIFIGTNLGYQAVVQWKDVLYPQWWLPMVDGFGSLRGGKGSPWGMLWAVVGVLGLLFYFQLSRRFFWLSRIVIGITIGIGAGLTFKSQFGQNLPQVLDSFKPLAPAMVRAAPRTLLRLPGAAFPPTIDGSLAVFVDGRTVIASETLGGAQVWRATIPGDATGAAQVAGSEVRVPLGGRDQAPSIRLDRDTGRLLGPGPALAVAHAEQQFQWTGRALQVASVADRVTIAELALPAPPSVPPAVAQYPQPQFTLGVLLVPSGSEVTAYALKDGVAANVRKGDRMWSATLPEPVMSLVSFDGTVLAQGRTGSELLQLPTPSPALGVTDYVDNWVFVITMIAVMTYFLFSFDQKSKVVIATSKAGRWVLMIGFGAFFGNTVMTRMSYLLDRLMFLIDDWLRPFWHHLFK